MKGVVTSAKKWIREQEKTVTRLMNGGCAVLLYHRVTTLDSDPQLLSVIPGNFEKHLQLLKQDYNVLRTDEFHHSLLNKIKFPPKSVYITFDDGYADNLLEAIPILESQEIQAMFYIATATLNTADEYWWDAIERILLENNSPKDATVDIEGRKINPAKFSKEERKQYYDHLLPALRKTSPVKRNKIIEELAAAFNSIEGRSTHRSLTFDELRKLYKSPSASIGAHTHHHPSLAALSREEQEDEIRTSLAILERETGSTIIFFSFPFGTVNDYNETTMDICKALKFSSVAANYPALVDRNSDAMHFPRFLVRDWNEKEFEQNLQNFFKA